MSNPEVEPWLDENYEQLRTERGWSYETLAANLATGDPGLAAHFRAKAAADGDVPSAPKGRKASAKATAEAAPAETAEA